MVPKNPVFRLRIGRKKWKTEKTGKILGLHVTYQIKASGTPIHVDTSKVQNSRKIMGKKPEKFCLLHLYHIAESHAADRPLPGEYF